MAKKNDLVGLVPSFIGQPTPKTNPVVDREAQTTDKPAEKKATITRATFLVHPDTVRKIKLVAMYRGIQYKDAVGAALEAYIAAYEQEHGKIELQ